ncbi:MAG: glycosyltransferase family 39 protein [Desulfobacterales bacterium]|nr:glycosyltransferase family 39 protein [Pseudomonadota bacterium]MBU4355022.1 glycosyltransferase family 39 protein [Pseudomonadota bacterium]MCG2773659.1 glycosyltransferase family 39 protein [Desulfobacterales bacterium]
MVLILMVAGLVLFFYRLGAPGLIDPDEGRYAEIAREFFVLRDWGIPHLNLLPYLEKPPLVYWLTALSFKVCGFTELAARLPSAVSALGGVLLAYGLGRAFWGPGPGVLGALVLASAAGYVALGRILTLDMTFALCLNLGIGLGYLALSRGQNRLWPWAYLALALAVLTKGPVALVLAGLVWVIWVAVNRRSGRSLIQIRGWVLLAVITLPWFVYVQWRYPEFFRFFVLEQHLGRFLTPAIHPEPLWYYVPVLLGLLLPWTWLLPWTLTAAGRWRDPDYRFLVIWAAVIVVFFSLSRGKLAPYILPALLPLALLVGHGLARLTGVGRMFFNSRFLKTSLLVWGVTGVGLVGLSLWPPALLVKALARSNFSFPYLLAVSLVWALTPLAALIFRHLGALLLGALLLSALVPRGIDQVSLGRSFKDMGLALKSRWQPGAALVGVHIYSQGLSFYSGHIFHLLGCRTELDFGQRLAPEKGLRLADKEALPAFTAATPVTFFFLKVRDLPWLAEGLPGNFRTVASHKDCILSIYEGK